MIERRTVWVRVEEPPEGWRWLRNDLEASGEFWALWTDAPAEDKYLQQPHKLMWIQSLPRMESREVTEWIRP